MRIELFKEVALSRDIPKEGLRRGDIATVVEHPWSGTGLRLPATQVSGGEEGYLKDGSHVLEFFNAIGESIAIVAVPASEVEPLRADEILSARPLAAAT